MHKRDELTGLPNRLEAIHELGEAIIYCRRHGNYRVAIFIDIKRFSSINDTFGHYSGDCFLIEVANRLKRMTMDDAIVMHLGGDEFLLLLHRPYKVKTIHSKSPKTLAKRLLAAIERPMVLANETISASAHIALVYFNNEAKTPSEILRMSNATMYKLKNMPQESIGLFTPEMAKSFDVMRKNEKELERAFENDEFELHYQPKVDIRSNQIVGVEALLRWNHPDKGLINACEFIDVLQTMDLYPKVAEWVLNKAIDQIDVLVDRNIWQSNMKLGINATAQDIINPDFFKTLDKASAKAGINPDQIQLELLEAIAFEDLNHAKKTMARFIKKGYCFSLDDFGTGYSSLMYLHELPFDTVKIDKAFITEMINKPSKMSLVKTFIDLAHKLNLSILAEGVENQRTLEVLRSYECDYYQGYVFSRAVSFSELSCLIETQGQGIKLVG